jgi:hypothetical protein
MRLSNLLIPSLFIILTSGCATVKTVTRHDFDSGFYTLKKDAEESRRIYADIEEDSLTVYPVITEGGKETPDITTHIGTKISEIRLGSYFYKNSYVTNSIDIDLSTVLMKLRPHQKEVPTQLSYNINAAVYAGLRKDFYKLIPHKSPLKQETSFVRQLGFDFGLFAGIGMTAMNPWVTEGKVPIEYDGIVFQKGFAGFITIDRMSVGLSLGFDNLLDSNKRNWVYNQKPYIGLMIGILNF